MPQAINPKYIQKRAGVWVLLHNPEAPADSNAVIAATDYPNNPLVLRDIMMAGSLDAMDIAFALVEPPRTTNAPSYHGAD